MEMNNKRINIKIMKAGLSVVMILGLSSMPLQNCFAATYASCCKTDEHVMSHTSTNQSCCPSGNYDKENQSCKKDAYPCTLPQH